VEQFLSNFQPIWQDQAILVISKPPGLPVLPDGYDKTVPHVRRILEPEFGRLWIVHRLDKETSGVMILARTADAHRELNRQFDERLVTKVYHALVVGSPEWDESKIDTPLQANGDRRHRTIPKPAGKPAVTSFKVIERFELYALIEARPATGRTHQIRSHLGFVAGLPLAADKLYGCKVLLEELPISRTALHAYSLNIFHPISGESFTFEAPYPSDFGGALAKLRA